MRNIAINCKDIAHIKDDDSNRRFYRISSLFALEEIINNISSMDEFVLFVEDTEEGGLAFANSLFDKKICSWGLLKKVGVNDADSREEAKKAMKATMLKIIARIRRDFMSDNAGETDLGIRNIEFDRWTYSTFGPVLDNCIGLSVAFLTSNPLTEAYNGDDWADS
jgi:hypothetical protein